MSVWQSAPGSRKALKPIEFWGYEASPFSRIVKVGPHSFADLYSGSVSCYET
jgi:hypothetical protein